MIQTPRLFLRHATEQDLPLLVSKSGDPVARGAFNPTRFPSPHAVHKRFHEGGYASDEYELFFICKPTGEVIGDVVHFLAKRYATARELGWCIYAPEDRQHGYATEAVTALVDYLFKSHPIHRIECHTSVDNHASLRLAEKCGFVREGIARGLVFIAGSFVDDVMLSILRHEWTPLPASSQTHTQSQADTWA